MKRLLGVLSGAVLSGCVSGVPDDARTHEFDGVYDAAGYWVREWELAQDTMWRFAANQRGINFRDTPQAFKDCAGEQAAKMSPPELIAAAERFVASKRWDDYRVALLMQREFLEDYEDSYGVKFGSRVEELCKDKLET